MSRSNYTCDGGDQELYLWRGAVLSATRGKRGQQFFRDLVAALDAMPEKKLIAWKLRDTDGAVCAMGALATARAIDVSAIDPEEPEEVAQTFGIAPALAQETAYINDEGGSSDETEERRWIRVRAWAMRQIRDGQ